MATIIKVEQLATTEIEQYDCDFTDHLETGDTVASATATHTPPSGAATTPVVGTISANVVPVKVGALAVTGLHYVSVLATTTGGLKHLIRLEIPVNF